jgi:hypothetical protein
MILAFIMREDFVEKIGCYSKITKPRTGRRTKADKSGQGAAFLTKIAELSVVTR